MCALLATGMMERIIPLWAIRVAEGVILPGTPLAAASALEEQTICHPSGGRAKMFSLGFEPRTVCVLDRRDNQLHHENMFCVFYGFTCPKPFL
jgi:hypothetical protein